MALASSVAKHLSGVVRSRHNKFGFWRRKLAVCWLRGLASLCQEHTFLASHCLGSSFCACLLGLGGKVLVYVASSRIYIGAVGYVYACLLAN